MADKYAKKDLAAQILVVMKRRAAFIAKCARETSKITASETLKARVLKQYAKLNAACGLGAVIPTTLPTWNLVLANTPALLATTGALDAVAYSTTTVAEYTAAHALAKTAFTDSKYVDKLLFTSLP